MIPARFPGDEKWKNTNSTKMEYIKKRLNSHDERRI